MLEELKQLLRILSFTGERPTTMLNAITKPVSVLLHFPIHVYFNGSPCFLSFQQFGKLLTKINSTENWSNSAHLLKGLWASDKISFSFHS